MSSSKGLYIHIPFCFKKCNYCNFTSFPISKVKPDIDSYIKILKNEIENYGGNKINTVYIGGGTPSLLKVKHVESIIKSINNNFIIDKLDEFTIEINPYNFDVDYIESLKSIGIDRFSFGFQSFDNEKLKKLGRLHRKKDLEKIKKYRNKIGNLSIDLIFGLKNDYKLIVNELENLLEFDPEHLSIYNLKVEKNTPLFKMLENNKINLDSEENQSKTYSFINNFLKSKGYNHYEISNYSKKRKESKHNLKYWNFEEYIGIGLAASGYINNVLYTNHDSFENYKKRKYKKLEQELEEKQKRYYKIMMGLRLKNGVKLQDEEHETLKNFLNNKDLERYFTFNNEKLAIKEKYFFISNSLIGKIVNKLF